MFSPLLRLIAILTTTAGSPLAAAPERTSQPKTAEPPSAALLQRAEKIVTALEVRDAAQAERVRDIIARQYADLSRIHAVRDAAVSEAKASSGIDTAAIEIAGKRAHDEARLRQLKLHYAFIGRLAAELTPAQIERVKDGMTYGVVPLTFRVYQELLPDLTPEQKRQIYAWLVEAREHAMDAGSSKEKHGWFGKYKGRINNYLAAAGIDLKQAEKDLAARRKAPAGAEQKGATKP